MKQEYNKIEYTSNVEYTNYYSSNLNTGTFPLTRQLKQKRRGGGGKKEENEKGNQEQVGALPDEFMRSLEFRMTGLILRCLQDARAELNDDAVCYSEGPEPTVNFLTIKKPTDLNYHIKCYM